MRTCPYCEIVISLGESRSRSLTIWWLDNENVRHYAHTKCWATAEVSATSGFIERRSGYDRRCSAPDVPQYKEK